MDDVITDIPPPSRFLLEDLNSFTLPPPSLPSPFLVFSPNDSESSYSPSLLIIAKSSPSIHFLHHLSKTLIGTVLLPEIPCAGNSLEPSLTDKSCNIYALNDDKTIMIILVQFSVSSERSHAVAKLIIGEKIMPQRVLILDSIQSHNFRGKLSFDEASAFKLETSLERKNSEAGNSSLIKGLDYYPSGSVVDGLAAALLSRCQLKKIPGTLCVSWPDLGFQVMSLVKSVLVKNVLNGITCSSNKDYEDEYARLSQRKNVRNSVLYT